MGEAPPYTPEQLLDLVSGLTIVGVRYTSDSVVFLTLDRDGSDVEVEVASAAVWDGASDHAPTASISSEITVYVRGKELPGE